ncbi:MAG: Bug family tripartite tricarboxylate transporter substrate binding protein [Burkholderiaceae bacterium]
MRSKAVVAALMAVGLAWQPAAQAQEYPGSKPVRFIVPFPAGSGTDTMSRMLLEQIRKATGATFVVENRPGALGQIGSDHVAKAAPDGYTVMMSSSATHSSGPHLVKKLPYDPLRDFTHMARLLTFDVALFVSSNSPYKSVNDLVADARKNPDKLTYGYGSATAQVVAATFVRSAGVSIRGVPYKGQPPALTDLISGQTTFVMADLAVGLPHAKSGRLRPLAVAAGKRSSVLPDVPTLTELGVRDVELQGWTGIAGPAGLPQSIVEWWNRQVDEAAKQPELIAKLRDMATEAAPLPLSAMGTMVNSQYKVWGQRIREAGIEAE